MSRGYKYCKEQCHSILQQTTSFFVRQRRRLPPSRKIWVFLIAIYIYFIAAPFLLGWVYNLVCIRTKGDYKILGPHYMFFIKDEEPINIQQQETEEPINNSEEDGLCCEELDSICCDSEDIDDGDYTAEPDGVFLVWMTGTALLYLWSYLCVAGVLTRRFRIFVLEGRDINENMDDGEDDENVDENNNGINNNNNQDQNDDNHNNNNNDDENDAAVAAEAAAAAEEEPPLAAADREGNDVGGENNNVDEKESWQGEQGRVAKFWNILKAVALHGEWDQVDHVVLLYDFALPVLITLLECLIVPILCTQFNVWMFHITTGRTKARLFCGFFTLVCTIPICSLWRDQLASWFEAAHKTARDERYLIGQVLMNYTPPTTTTTDSTTSSAAEEQKTQTEEGGNEEGD